MTSKARPRPRTFSASARQRRFVRSGYYEDARLLQEDGAVQPRRQDEMPLEQRARLAKDVGDLVLFHECSRQARVRR